MSKELFIAEYERLEAEALDRGLTQEQAAEDNAYDAMRERLADIGDRERKIRRGE